MMIRINLLPVRAVKKREMGRQVLVLFAVVLLGAGLGNYFWYADRAWATTSGTPTPPPSCRVSAPAWLRPRRRSPSWRRSLAR